MTELSTTAAIEETWNRDASVFGEMLARDVAAGDINLPGFPPVILRVQQVLGDERADAHDIVQAISADPALAMLVLRMANSAAFNRAGMQARDLDTAVRRIGTRLVRAAALAMIVQSLRSADELRTLRDRLGAVWRRGIVVGSLCKALAARTGVVAPDAALLTGLLHVVGRLYVLVRMGGMPHLFDQNGIAEKLLGHWGGPVASVLLLKWEMPREYCAAVAQYQQERDPHPADLGDVLAAADVLADLMPPSRADYLDQVRLAETCGLYEPLLQRLAITRADCSDAIHAALEDVHQLRALFGA